MKKIRSVYVLRQDIRMIAAEVRNRPETGILHSGLIERTQRHLARPGNVAVDRLSAENIVNFCRRRHLVELPYA